MSYPLPIDVPEAVDPVGLLKRQIKAYEDAIKNAQTTNSPYVRQYERELKIWRQILKREEHHEAMFWGTG